MSVGAQIGRELSDEELIREFLDGHKGAFRTLFDRYQRKVYTGCRMFLQDASAAEDATQETFLRAYQNLGRFVGGNFPGWLMRIAKNVCIDQWRRQKHQVEVDEQHIANLPDRESLEDATAFRLAAQKIEEGMTLLPAEQRRCLELKIAGYSYEEMAAATGFSVQAVKSHLQNGRRMLWLRLNKVLDLEG
jgi:RNA polymerase sigma-70 factor, ECF subfamily